MILLTYKATRQSKTFFIKQVFVHNRKAKEEKIMKKQAVVSADKATCQAMPYQADT